MVAIGFLLFCYRGFTRTQMANRSKRKAVNVFPLNHEKRSFTGNGKPLLALLVLSMFPATAARAQTGGQSAADANAKQAGAAPALQAAPAETSPAAPLPTPSMAGPLKLPPPILFDAGPLGKLALNGILSGMGAWQDHPSNHDHDARADISNAQIFLQKSSGILQFYLQAGAYNIPALGIPFISTGSTVNNFFGALPVGYFSFVPKNNLSLAIGQLPTLMGNEDTFSFQNVDVERGLLWNQTNDISRGMQINYSRGPLSGSFSWNDGYYSNRYNWLTGALTYTINPKNSIGFTGGGNLGHTGYSAAATPLYLNNSRLYDLIYTRTSTHWTLSPYIQFNYVPKDLRIAVPRTTATEGAAFLASYSWTPHFFLAGRTELIASTGSVANGALNLIYGPGSQAWSLTLTPTYQKKMFFARPEFSFVQAFNSKAGEAFGPQGQDSTQVRAIVELGWMF